jgi:predicted  nucleic acid-binding Zn-ribbon protein
MGCKPSTTETTRQQLDKAQAATKNAAQQMQDYTFAQKAEFVAKMQTQLAELNRNLDELSAAIEKSSDKVKAEATPKLVALRAQATELTKQLDKITNATSSTWSSIKAESEKVYAALKAGLAQSRQWLSDKIAP